MPNQCVGPNPSSGKDVTYRISPLIAGFHRIGSRAYRKVEQI